MAVLLLAATYQATLAQSEPIQNDPLAISPGTYTVCDDARDTRDPQSIHLKVGDKVSIASIGAAAEVQFDRRLISMVASGAGREVSTVLEFTHVDGGTPKNMKHLVRIVRDPGYDGSACTAANVLAIDFCPQAADGSWQCRVLNCETKGACHLGHVHTEN